MKSVFSGMVVFLMGAILVASPPPPTPPPPGGETRMREMTPAQERAIQKGIDWLLKIQSRNGLWGCERSGAPCTAITGLSVLGLLATGSTPSEGPYAEPIRRAADRLMALQMRNGEISQFNSTGMGIFYDHSCATLALAEIYGMSRGSGEEMADIRQSLEAAVALDYIEVRVRYLAP